MVTMTMVAVVGVRLAADWYRASVSLSARVLRRAYPFYALRVGPSKPWAPRPLCQEGKQREGLPISCFDRLSPRSWQSIFVLVNIRLQHDTGAAQAGGPEILQHSRNGQ